MVVQKPEISPELRHLLNELQTINLNSKSSTETSSQISPTENLLLPSEADKPAAKTNSKNEETILDYAEHFRQQYMYLYRDRQPLFLFGENEASTKKFVSTSLRPSLVNHDELYSWQGCAEFVSDAILPKMLKNPTELPSSLASPIEVLRRQEAHCFEMSGLLASLLLGAGYDAFVVSGYATREICLADKTRLDTDVVKHNPALEEIDSAWDKQFPEVNRKKTRYVVRPVKDLTSKFDQKMKNKEVRKGEEKIEAEREGDFKKQMLAERPTEDELYGVRIHSWVLVRPGRREVPKAFFIDPFSGASFGQDCDELLGVESIYNHNNYYVCMQDCSEGCVTLNWDVNDPVFWESLLPHKFEELVTRKDDGDADFGEEEEEEDEGDDEDEDSDDGAARGKSGDGKKTAIKMPQSWVSEVELTREMYETRCPSGKRTFYFKRAKLDKYAPYLRPDGMTQQLSLFNKLDYHIDLASNPPKEIREWFSNRLDCLNFRIHDKNSDWVCETFNVGRENYAIRKHKFNLLTPQPSAPRTLYFYNNARADGLFSRHISPKSMVEKFINRSDRLILRVVEYANEYNKPVVDKKRLQAADFSQQRPIVQITDQFSSSTVELGKDDAPEIVELVYYLTDEDAKIHVTYHRTLDKISPCTRQFEKPSIGHQVSSDTALTGTGSVPSWDEELCQCYSNQIATDRAGTVGSITAKETGKNDSHEDKPSHRELFGQLKELMVQEVNTMAAVRLSEEEVAELLKERQKERMSQELNISIYDTGRNLKAKKRREELERMAKEDAERRNDHSMDFLAPFLCKMGISDSSKITSAQSQELYKECLNDLKTRLVNMANLIQERFDIETKELERRQARYQVKQVHITKEEEEEYVNYCADATFRIHILETRLNEHKKKAPIKYSELEKKIRTDARLAKHF